MPYDHRSEGGRAGTQPDGIRSFLRSHRLNRPRTLVAGATALLATGVLGAAGCASGTGTHDGTHARRGSTTTRTKAAAPSPKGIPGTWHLVFDDEFSGTGLDRSRWQPGWFGSGVTPPVNSEESGCYDSSQVTVSGGSLHLTALARPTTCGGVTRPYVSGLVSTNPAALGSGRGFQFTYGAVEARMNLPGSGGRIDNWPAFWTDGQNWPADGEMDVVEGLGGQACWHFHSPAGGPGDCAARNLTGWHTYGARWSPGRVTYYYDGTPVGTITGGVTSAPMYLIANLAMSRSDGGPVAAPSTVGVDYVRVWQ